VPGHQSFHCPPRAVVPHGPISIQPRRNTEVNGHAETRRKSREVVGKSGPPRHHAFHSRFSAPPPLCGSPVSVFLGLDSPPRLGVSACRSPPDHPTASHQCRGLDGDERDLVPFVSRLSAFASPRESLFPSQPIDEVASNQLGVGRFGVPRQAGLVVGVGWASVGRHYIRKRPRKSVTTCWWIVFKASLAQRQSNGFVNRGSSVQSRQLAPLKNPVFIGVLSLTPISTGKLSTVSSSKNPPTRAPTKPDPPSDELDPALVLTGSELPSNRSHRL
jgi:hypothetical protein